MADQKLVQLVEQLAKKTAEQALVWEKTVDEDTFQTAFPGYSVRLGTRPSTKSRYLGAPVYAIQILNESGELIEETTDEDLDGDRAGEFYRLMKEMHQNARRTVMGVNRAIDSIMEKLGG